MSWRSRPQPARFSATDASERRSRQHLRIPLYTGFRSGAQKSARKNKEQACQRTWAILRPNGLCLHQFHSYTYYFLQYFQGLLTETPGYCVARPTLPYAPSRQPGFRASFRHSRISGPCTTNGFGNAMHARRRKPGGHVACLKERVNRDHSRHPPRHRVFLRTSGAVAKTPSSSKRRTVTTAIARSPVGGWDRASWGEWHPCIMAHIVSDCAGIAISGPLLALMS